MKRERAQSFLTDDHTGRIVDAFRAFRPEEGFAAVESLDAIAERNSNLSIPLYVNRESDRADHDLERSVADWRQSTLELRSAAADLFERLEAGAPS